MIFLNCQRRDVAGGNLKLPQGQNEIPVVVKSAEAFKKIPEAEDLFYPSVQVDAGMCLALKPSTYDQKMRIVSSHVLRISRVRPFGFYDYDVCMEATGISDSGEFIWREPRSSRSRYYFNLTKEEAENHSE